MMAGSSPKNSPRYWSPNSSADREELCREVEYCLDSDGPPEYSAPLPPIDPFGEWWDALPDDTRRKLQARAEDFRSFKDFFYGHVAKDMDFGPVGETAREWINRNLAGLFADEKMTSADRPYTRKRIARFLLIANAYLDLAFGVPAPAHRQVANVDRDRQWSKQNYEGQTYSQIADAYNSKTGEAVDETAIRTAVDRHRKRREGLTRYIGWELWVAGIE